MWPSLVNYNNLHNFTNYISYKTKTQVNELYIK